MIMRAAHDANGVHEALGRSAAILTRAGPSAWYVTLQNGKRVDAVAALDGHWLSLSASLAPVAPGAAWRMLALNTRLRGGVRIAFARATHAPTLRTDSWLGPDHDIASRVDDACAALLDAASIAVNHDALESPDRELNAGSCDVVPTDSIDTLVSELAWPHTLLDDGTCRFDLDARRERYHAVLTAGTDGWRCGVEVVARPTLSDSAREAIASALLTSSGALRLTRPTATSNDTTDRVGFEVVLSAAPSAEELDLALGALGSVCDQLGREARALTDPTLATAYLGVAMPHRHIQPGE